MYYLITILILAVSVLLILVVLVQNSKGGGLAANFAGNNQVMGVRRTSDFLEKSTWTLAIVVLALSILATMFIRSNGSQQNESAVKGQIENTVDMSSETSGQDAQEVPAAQDAQQ